LEFYKDLVESFDPHPTNAQIFFEIDENQITLEQAQSILESVGVKTLHCRIIEKDDRDWALILISSNDMREATLKLSEAGFTRVLGINPRHITKTSKGR
jgi:hypothetical protein